MEIIITGLLLITSGYIIFKTLKKSSKGNCNCGSCSSQCPKYNKK